VTSPEFKVASSGSLVRLSGPLGEVATHGVRSSVSASNEALQQTRSALTTIAAALAADPRCSTDPF